MSNFMSYWDPVPGEHILISVGVFIDKIYSVYAGLWGILLTLHSFLHIISYIMASPVWC